MSAKFHTLSLTPDSVRVRGKHLSLTAHELAILRVLVESQANGEHDLTSHASLDDVMETLHATHDPSPTAIRVLIFRIRKKLAAAGAGVRIKAETGVGYKLETEETA